MTKKYLISVIVPCFNKYNSIDITLRSIIAQTIFSRLEVIIVDDCSTDRSIKKLERYESKYSNIKLYKMTKNSSVFCARKLGISAAKADYIGFIDMDDRIDRSYFEELYKAFDKDTDIVQTFSVYKDFGNGRYKDAKSTYYKYNRDGKYHVDLDDVYFSNMIVTNWNTLWNRLFRASVLKPLVGMPNYYINFLEDIAIMFVSYMNSSVVKTYNTRAKYYYNLTNEVSHLTTSRQREMKAESTAQAFHMINYYIMYSRHFEYYELIKKFRKMYLDMFARNTVYRNSFNLGKSIMTVDEMRSAVVAEHFAASDEDSFEQDEIDKIRCVAEMFSL